MRREGNWDLMPSYVSPATTPGNTTQPCANNPLPYHLPPRHRYHQPIMKIGTTIFAASLATASAGGDDWWAPPTQPPAPPVCGDGTNPVVSITGAERAEWAGGDGAIFGGNTYNFTDTLDNLDCQGRVDFVREEFLFHPFRLCVGGIVGNATDPTDGSKCESKFQQGCGIDCFDYQVGIDLAPSRLGSESDPESCTSIDISGRELWYVCTVDSHDMYNRLC